MKAASDGSCVRLALVASAVLALTVAAVPAPAGAGRPRTPSASAVKPRAAKRARAHRPAPPPQPPRNGEILDEQPCDPMPARDDLVEVIVRQGQDPSLLPSRERYDHVVQHLACRRIRYGSGGLRVTGFIYQPTDVPGRRPAIVYARGGNREYGSLPNHLPYSLLSFVEKGFVVLATQYRGNDGGEGREDFGGKDVEDVLSLITVARSLPYVDADNVFLLGYSRGGMMTFLALARGAPVRAAAVIGAPADLLSDPRRDEMMPVYRELIPDFEGREEEALRRRSAVEWADRISTPVLILHGRNDDRVIVRDAERLAERLWRAGRPHRLVIYEKAGHNLGSHALERDQRILAWFHQHLGRKAPGRPSAPR